jgi:outer membrane protein assembly factor BamB
MRAAVACTAAAISLSAATAASHASATTTTTTTGVSTANAVNTSKMRWPQRVLVHEPLTIPNQAISGKFLYELNSQTNTPARGPYLLERVNLRSGAVQRGPLFTVGDLAVADGRLWVFGSIGKQPHLIEVDPQKVSVTRVIPLLKATTNFPWLAIGIGPNGSIWLGTSGTLRRIDAATGKTLVTVAAPPRLAVADLASDPSGRYLYVSMANEVKGGLEGGTVVEYDAHTGRELAHATAGPPLSYSVAGATLAAVPGGVWASFRTGMLGLTIHLRQQDLALQAPPGPHVGSTPANSLFHWPMDATTVYSGGSLWLANEAGIVACLNPTTGAVRALERVPSTQTPDLVAVDTIDQQLFAREGNRLIQISPPKTCW